MSLFYAAHRKASRSPHPWQPRLWAGQYPKPQQPEPQAPANPQIQVRTGTPFRPPVQAPTQTASMSRPAPSRKRPAPKKKPTGVKIRKAVGPETGQGTAIVGAAGLSGAPQPPSIPSPWAPVVNPQPGMGLPVPQSPYLSPNAAGDLSTVPVPESVPPPFMPIGVGPSPVGAGLLAAPYAVNAMPFTGTQTLAHLNQTGIPDAALAAGAQNILADTRAQAAAAQQPQLAAQTPFQAQRQAVAAQFGTRQVSPQAPQQQPTPPFMPPQQQSAAQQPSVPFMPQQQPVSQTTATAPQGTPFVQMGLHDYAQQHGGVHKMGTEYVTPDVMAAEVQQRKDAGTYGMQIPEAAHRRQLSQQGTPFAERRANRIAQANPWMARQHAMKQMEQQGGTPFQRDWMMGGQDYAMAASEARARESRSTLEQAEAEALRQQLSTAQEPVYQIEEQINQLYQRYQDAPFAEWRPDDQRRLRQLEEQRAAETKLAPLPWGNEPAETAGIGLFGALLDVLTKGWYSGDKEPKVSQKWKGPLPEKVRRAGLR